MIVYSAIMFVIAVLSLVFGMSVYRGNTKLIHDYHQTHVREADRQAYGRAFAAGLFAICATLLVSGAVALFDLVRASLVMLLAGLIVSMAILLRVQKKYNGGLF